MFHRSATSLLNRYAICSQIRIQSALYLILKKQITINYTADGLLLPVTLQKYHAKEYRVFRRRAIGIIRNDPESKGKTVDEYVKGAFENTAVMDDDNYDEVIETHKENVNDIPDKKYQPHTSKTSKRGRESTEHESLKNLNFKLFEDSRGVVKKIFEYGKSSKMRQKHDIFLVEGWRLLAEALSVGLKPVAILYSRSRLLANMAPILSKGEQQLADYLNLFPVYKASYDVLQTWTSLKTSPGIIGAFNLSEATSLCQTPRETNLPVTVILDGIKDPSNLGSIIRSLVAVGVEKIILMKGCCDPWDTKVLRASAGGHFHMHCTFGTKWSEISNHISSSPTVYIADSYDEQTDDTILKPQTFNTNEAFSKLKELSLIESNEQMFYTVDKCGKQIYHNGSFKDWEHLKIFSDLNLPATFYDKIKFYNTPEDLELPTVLVVGGETGVSNEAKKFAVENGGLKLSIPMSNGIESLNTSVAISILAYEIRKQFLSLKKKVKKVDEQFN